MHVFNKQIQKEIIEYCRTVISNLNENYLQENDVLKNEFLDFIYLNCVKMYKDIGDYKLNHDEITTLFSIKRKNEKFMKKIKNKEAKILGIDKYDTLIIDLQQSKGNNAED